MSETGKRNLLIVVILVAIAFFALRPKKSAVERPEETGKPYTEVAVSETPQAAELKPPTPAREVKAPTARPLPVAPSLPMDKIQALRNQARANLSAAFTAQRAFRAEFGRYTTDLKAAGWAPNNPNMAFKFGFLAEFRADTNNDPPTDLREDPRQMTTDAFVGERYDDMFNFRYEDSANAVALNDYSRFCRTGCTANDDFFEMIMAVPLGDTDHVDVWMINEQKQMELVLDGITGQTPERMQTSEPISNSPEDANRPGPNPQTISR